MKKKGKKKPSKSGRIRARRQPPKKRVFLRALAAYPSVLKACEIADVPRSTVYDWRDQDEEFAAAWDAAKNRGFDAVEDEAVRRAYEGVLKPVFQGGVEVGQVREFSDQLMVNMLRAHRPKYRDKSTLELTGKNGKPVQHEHKQQITLEEFRKLPLAERIRIMRAEVPTSIED